ALDNLERENEQLSLEMEQMKDEIKDMEEKITVAETSHEKTLKGLEQVLQSYQRLGTVSYLEIILDSRSPGDFLRRINILKDLARNTEQLLNSIQESKSRLVVEKEKQNEKLAELADKQRQLEKSVEQVILLRGKMEERLASLEKEREYYQEQLVNMQQVWGKLKPFFSKTIADLSQIIAKGDLPLDAVKTSITLKGIQGSLDEETFNEIIAGHPGLPDVVFRFSEGQALLELPESSLLLEGNFVIREKTAIMYQVTKGAFYGFPLDDDTIKELFQDNQLVIDFKPLIGTNILRSIEIHDQKVELFIAPVLFRN
ncbi:MAG TPA: hypothetical protein GX711_00165, partial [Clostridia bacterium]|nr:hypothetical protein [Clostridia bacterium]